MARYVNDGSEDPPKLLVYLNEDNLAELRPDSSWPGLTGRERLEHLAADGFDGIQLTGDATPLEGDPFPHCGCDRINTPCEADSITAKHVARGHTCITVHAGWGLENDREAFDLVEAILTASERHHLPVFIETHRSTITQDLWRTVQLVKKFPEMYLNGDFSHYYTGQEMVYGGFEMKCAFIAPILERIGFLHGRVASPGCMQVPVERGNNRPHQAHGEVNYQDHFEQLWVLAMTGFIHTARPGDCLIFAPELLSGRHYYARMFPGAGGELCEETDRYEQALALTQLAHACFARASRGQDH